ncbi:MAG: YbaK/EbsC family protein [Patescibacteria group bacterium]|nr:YbaK/EbsC family protein [Patescibacteria group bacterium]
MPIPKHLNIHLGKKNYKFDIVEHKKVFTAYDLAQTLGEKLDSIAKTLLVEADLPELKKKGKGHYLVVVPASYYVDLQKVKKALKAKKVSIAPERVMKRLGIEPGALSPFGSMRGLGVLVDKALLKTKDAIVGAESFTDSVRLKVKDLVAAEQAAVAVLGKRNKMRLQAKPAKKKSVKRKVKKGKAVKKAAKKAGKRRR